MRLYRDINDLNLLDKDQIYSALILWKEKNNENGFYNHFIKFLPKDFNGFPIHYTKEEKKIAKGSSIDYLINFWLDQLSNEYESLKNLQTYIIDFSLEEYIQLRHSVWSRTFSLKKDDEEYSSMMPVSDLFNYYPKKANTNWYYDNDKKVFKIEAVRDIKKGEEILLSYGDKSNLTLLFFYGFTISENPFHIEIELDISNKSPKIGYPYEIDEAMTVFRKCKNDIKNYKKELNYVKKLKMHLKNLLKGYATGQDPEKDKEKLNSLTNQYFNLSNIYRVIIEKTLLINYIELLTKLENILTNYKEKILLLSHLDKLIKDENNSKIYLEKLKENIKTIYK